MNKFLTVLAMAVVSVGCSKQTPLTDAQKQVVSGTMTSVERGRKSSVNGAKNTPAATPNASQDATPSDDPQTKMDEFLAKSRADQQCDEIDFQVKNSSSSASSMGMNLKVKFGGKSCPVSMDWALDINGKANGDGGSADIAFRCNYSVKDEEFRKLNDVDSIALSGTGKAEGKGDSAKMNLEAKGTIHSQTKGNLNVELKVNASQNGNSVEVENIVSLKYPDFTAELKTKTNGKETEYFVNDEKVTEQEFQRIARGGAAGFMA
ncbi:MAG: hypothetical protein AB7P04_15065, partial [Bacteriovoracia bacterium]